jgi:subtilisin family serine protease
MLGASAPHRWLSSSEANRRFLAGLFVTPTLIASLFTQPAVGLPTELTGSTAGERGPIAVEAHSTTTASNLPELCVEGSFLNLESGEFSEEKTAAEEPTEKGAADSTEESELNDGGHLSDNEKSNPIESTDGFDNTSQQRDEELPQETPVITCPAAPTGVRVVPGPGEVTISWDPAPSNETNALATFEYVVVVTPGERHVSVLGSETIAVIDDLKNGIDYQFVVRAVNENGSSPPSDMVLATPFTEDEPEIVGLIVEYEPGARITEAPGVATGSSSVKEAELQPGKAIGFGLRTVLFEKPVPESTAELLAQELEKSPDVRLAEPDYVVRLSRPGASSLAEESEKTRPLVERERPQELPEAQSNFFSQSLTNQTSATWGLDRIDQRGLPLNNTYSYNTDGSGVDVYIIDTGIRASHNQFGGRVTSGYTTISDGRGTQDCDGHGTHVAGTVGGNIHGVAKNVRLVPVRVLNCRGEGNYSQVISALNWVRNHNASNPARPSVANLSLGGPPSSNLDSAVRALVSDKITVVVASGNDGVNACLVSPARVSEAITVNASTIRFSRDVFTSWSNYGSCTDLYAPGDVITSAWWTSDSATEWESGTSMAAPHVAGAAARLLQIHPTWTPAQVWNKIRSDATDVDFGLGSLGDPNRLLFISPQTSSATAPSAPTITGTTLGSGQIAVAFRPGSDGGSTVTNYQFSTNGGESWQVRSPASTTSPLVISGLNNGASYSVRIRAVNPVGVGAQSNVVLGTPFTVPDPTPIAEGDNIPRVLAGNGTITVSWSSTQFDAPEVSRGSPVTRVRVRAVSEVSGRVVMSPWVDIRQVRSGSAVITGLINNQAHRVEMMLWSFAASDWVELTGVGSADRTPVAVAPGVVTGVRGSDRGTGETVRVSWSAPRDTGGAPIIGYRVMVSADNGASWTVAVEDTESAARTVDVPGLTHGTSYLFQVQGRNYIDWGPLSGSSRAVAPTGRPVEPVVAGVTAGNGRLTVDVTRLDRASAGGLAVSYRVTATHPTDTRAYRTRTCTIASSNTFTGSASCVVTGLTNGQAYTVTAVAVNSRGTSPAGASIAEATTRTPVAVAPGVVTGVRGSDRGTGETVRVSWSAPRDTGGAPIIGYRVMVSADNGASWTVAVEDTESAARTVDVPGLTHGTSYLFQVQGRNYIDWGPLSGSSRAVAPTGRPVEPVVAGVTAGNGRLTVDVTRLDRASAGGLAVSYRVTATHPTDTRAYRTRTCTIASSNTFTGSASCVVTGLTNGQAYTVTAVAVNSRGTSPAGASIAEATTRTPVAVAPGVVTGVRGSDRGTGETVRVSWSAPRDTGGAPIIGYRVMVSADNGASWTVAVEDTESAARTVDVPGLTHGTSYLFQVQGRNYIDWGPLSGSSRAVAPTGRPVEPVVAGVTAGNGRLTVDVTRLDRASAGGLAVSYRVTATHPTDTRAYRTRTCTIASSNTFTGSASCVVTGLTNGQAYTVTAVAVNSRGTSPAGASIAEATTRTPVAVAPGVVTGVRGSDRGTGETVRVSWSAPRDTGGAPIIGYRVMVSADNGASWTVAVEDTESAARTVDVPGLTHGTSYLFQVQGRNYIDWGPLSGSSRAVAPTGRPVEPVVAGVTAGNGRLTVDVTRLDRASAGGLAVSYRVTATHPTDTRAYRTRTCTIASSNTFTGSASCVVTGLTNGQAYTVTAVAVNSRGTSPAGTSTGFGSADRTPVPEGFPRFTGEVSLTGALEYGETLTLSVDRVNDSPTPQIRARWYRCDSEPDRSSEGAPHCEFVEEEVELSGPGETLFEYPLGTVDIGKFVAVEVVARNSVGSARQFVVSEGEILAAPNFVGEHYFTHSGRAAGLDSTVSYPTVGQFIRTPAGTNMDFNGGWVSFPTADFSYQWFLCDGEVNVAAEEISDDYGCEPFGGEVNVVRLPPESLGRFVMVEVTGVNTINGVQREKSLFMPSAPVTGAPLQIQANASFSGTPLAPVQQPNDEFGLIELNPGNWSGFPEPDFVVEWSICGKQNTDLFAPWNCDVRSGVSGLDYELRGDVTDYSAHGPRYLYAKLVAENPINRVEQVVGGLQTLSAPFRWGPPPSIRSETVNGVPAVTINTDFPWFHGSPEIDITVEWLRCESALSSWSVLHDVTCVSVPATAEGATYMLTPDDNGKHVAAVIRGENIYGSREFKTDTVAPVGTE